MNRLASAVSATTWPPGAAGHGELGAPLPGPGNPPQHYRRSGPRAWRENGARSRSATARSRDQARFVVPADHARDPLADADLSPEHLRDRHGLPGGLWHPLGAEPEPGRACGMLWDMARYHNYDIRSPYNRDAALWVANQTTFRFPLDARAAPRPACGPGANRRLPGTAPAAPGPPSDRGPRPAEWPGERRARPPLPSNSSGSSTTACTRSRPPRSALSDRSAANGCVRGRRADHPRRGGRTCGRPSPPARGKSTGSCSSTRWHRRPRLPWPRGRALTRPRERPWTSHRFLDEPRDLDHRRRRPLQPAPPDPLVAAGSARRGAGAGRRRGALGNEVLKNLALLGRRHGLRDRLRRGRALEPLALGPVPRRGRRPAQGRGRRAAGAARSTPTSPFLADPRRRDHTTSASACSPTSTS